MTTKLRVPILFAILASLLALPTTALADGDGHSVDKLELMLAEAADTPAEHRALAGYYSAKAEDARQRAEHHRAMAKSYQGNLGTKNRMKRHCARLTALNEELAQEYDGLAREHQQAANR